MANVLRRVSLFGLNWRVLSATALVGVLAIPYIPWAACNRLEDYLITLRYARNAAAGIGAVFSEGQLYQGFTSPLQFCIGYLLCLASLGEETIPSIICLTGLLGIVLLGVNLAYWVVGRLSFSALTVAVCLVLSSENFLEHVGFDSVWAIGFASTSLSLLTRSRYLSAGITLALAILVRHDTALLSLLVSMSLLVERNWRGLLRVTTPLIALTLPWYAFATWYWGSPLPITLGEKINQGHSGYPIFNQTFGQVMQKPFQWFPLNSGMLLAGAIVFMVVGVAWWIIRRTREEYPIKWSHSSISRLISNPFFLFSTWAVLQFVAYFAVLRVPPIYGWYHAYIVAALLVLLGIAPIWLAAQGECRFIRLTRERKVRWKDLSPILLAVAVVYWAGFASFEHFNRHIPRDNPGRYRYEGYHAAAKWINANAEASDIIRIGEIGVFGWYCPLNIEDLGCITMRRVPDEKTRFRYLVKSADPESSDSRLLRSLLQCELVASFANPNDYNILVFKKKAG